MSEVSEFDCQKCGACCSSPWTGEGYAYLYDDDQARLIGTSLPIFYFSQEDTPDVTEAKLGTRLDGRGKRVCVALDGNVGDSCSCSVYELRPTACRKFKVGSVLCIEARKRVGIV